MANAPIRSKFHSKMVDSCQVAKERKTGITDLNIIVNTDNKGITLESGDNVMLIIVAKEA